MLATWLAIKTYLILIFCSCFTELSGKYSRGFSLLCWVSTLGNLAIISRDRFLALSKPWWYRNHVTRSLVVKQAILVWISAVLLAIYIRLIWLGSNACCLCILPHISSCNCLFLYWNFHRKQTSKAGRTPARIWNTRCCSTRKEIGQHSRIDLNSSLLHFPSRALGSINFLALELLKRWISPFSIFHWSFSHAQWIFKPAFELWKK